MIVHGEEIGMVLEPMQVNISEPCLWMCMGYRSVTFCDPPCHVYPADAGRSDPGRSPKGGGQRGDPLGSHDFPWLAV